MNKFSKYLSTINELALTIAKVVGFTGKINFDVSKPDGAPRKLLEVSRLKNMGWQYSTDIEQGLAKTYAWFLEHIELIRT